MAHGLRCSMLCGILPDQGSNGRFSSVAGRFFPTEPPNKLCPPSLVGKTLASMIFPEFQKVDSNNFLIEGEATKETT